MCQDLTVDNAQPLILALFSAGWGGVLMPGRTYPGHKGVWAEGSTPVEWAWWRLARRCQTEPRTAGRDARIHHPRFRAITTIESEPRASHETAVVAAMQSPGLRSRSVLLAGDLLHRLREPLVGPHGAPRADHVEDRDKQTPQEGQHGKALHASHVQ